ncbi:hypothetical protein ROG8370_02391 [Roseovarius gaetbuli]|uniref:Uncharacterized protein n=1 Tax=Roseovarius gaetbuli TaxID=1356575 RepID=A0A1X6ZLH7_9RHOB|nr:hypothetical protein [Roseovarius gaetbuli]SLN52909.1 hypothetical protein ROG8370_02391 [Roseovarius gaetbuli]
MGIVKLCSFADGAFEKRKVNFKDNVIASGFFDDIHIADCNSLPVDFLRFHEAFMRATVRGFGYWIWKPALILAHLVDLGPEDVLVYADAGFTFNPQGRRRFDEYLELTRDAPDRMLSFQNVFVESHYSKMDLSYRLGLCDDDSHLKTSQLGSGLIFLQKTNSNIELLRSWASIAVEDAYHFSDDSVSHLSNHPDFIEHRHDQSIASLLRKIRGTAITHYEVQDYSSAFGRLKGKLPALATRLRH